MTNKWTNPSNPAVIVIGGSAANLTKLPFRPNANLDLSEKPGNTNYLIYGGVDDV